MKKRRTELVFVYFLLLVLLGLTEYLQYLCHELTINDAFISYRYAENFAQGHGLVFNFGEYVEGYSNLLLTLILAGFIKIGFQPHGVSVMIGHLAGLGVVFLSFLISSALREKKDLFSLIAPAVLAVNPMFIYWSNGGLETQLNVFLLLLLLFFVHLRYIKNENKHSIPLIVSAVLFILNRPENFIFVIGLLVFLIVLNFKFIKSYYKSEAVIFSSILAALAILIAWRVYYYGYPLPNCVYAKSLYQVLYEKHKWSLWDIFIQFITRERSINYSVGFLNSIGGVFILLPALLVVFLSRINRRMYLILYMVILFYTGLVFWGRGGWMPYYRLFTPVLPVVYILVSMGVAVIVERVFSGLWIKRAVAAVVLCFGVAFTFGIPNISPLPERIEAQSELGKKLNRISSPREILASTILGTVSYYYRGYVLDMFGLTDEYIAHHGKPVNVGRMHFWYVASKRPTYFVTNTWRPMRMYFRDNPGEREQFRYFESKRYRKIKIYLFVRRSKLNSSNIGKHFTDGKFVRVPQNIR